MSDLFEFVIPEYRYALYSILNSITKEWPNYVLFWDCRFNLLRSFSILLVETVLESLVEDGWVGTPDNKVLHKKTVFTLRELVGNLDLQADPTSTVFSSRDLISLDRKIRDWGARVSDVNCITFKYFNEGLVNLLDPLLLDMELLIPRPLICLSYQDWLESNLVNLVPVSGTIEVTDKFSSSLGYMERVILEDIRKKVQKECPQVSDEELLSVIHQVVCSTTTSLVNLATILLLFLMYEENGNKEKAGVSNNFMLNWLVMTSPISQDYRQNKVLQLSIENVKSVLCTSQVHWVSPIPLLEATAKLTIMVPETKGIKTIVKEYSYSLEENFCSSPMLH